MGRFRIKANIFVITLFFLNATLGLSKDLPSMGDILDIQYRCDVNAFQKLEWAEPPGLGNLAIKSWAIVSELKTEELPYRSITPKVRKFKVKFKGWDMINCGIDAKTLDPKISMQDKEIVFEISERSKTNQHIILAAEDTNSDGTLKDQWGQFLFTSGEEGNSDEIGLTCLVDKKKFVNDIKAVQLDKLCKNESQRRRKITEEYLRELQRKLKRN